MTRTSVARLLSLALLAPASALAAGFEVPDNGAGVNARGGTAVADFGNAYGLQFNPATIAFQDGLDVRIDLRLVNDAITFERAPRGNESFDQVSNTAGAFMAPFLAASYRSPKLLGGRLALGLGIFGPPGVGKYSYEDPEKLKAEGAEPAEINARTGHRYSLIANEITIMYPSVGLAYRVLENLSFGVTLQSAAASIKQSQAMAALSLGGQETYDLDALVKLDLSDPFTPTLVAGAAWEPIPGLRVGASFRPKVSLEAEGALDVVLPELAKSQGYEVQGNKRATLALALPPVARLGASYTLSGFTGAAELVYEGWSVNHEFTLTPDATIKYPDGATKKLEPMPIEKQWKDSYGARLGASYEVLGRGAPVGVTVHAGGLFETNVIPTAYQSLDFVTGDRLGGGGGVTITHRSGVGLTLSGIAYKPVKFEITDSKVHRAVADEEPEPVIVGNGIYTAQAWVAAIGLSYSSPAAPKEIE